MKLEKKIYLDLSLCLLIVFAFFIPTLSRPWLSYDERLIYDNIYFPVANSFREIFEITGSIGNNFNVISSNPIYSYIYLIRGCPFNLYILLLSSFFLKKNAFLYHLLALFFHLLNTGLFYFILKTLFSREKLTILSNRFLLIGFTLLWALNPLILESVLLTTNFTACISYTFFFGFLLEYLINSESDSLLRKVLIPFIFLVPMLNNEYLVSLPLLIILFSFYKSYQNNPFKKASKISLRQSSPYLVGLLLYVIFFSVISNSQIIQSLKYNQLTVFIERIFWLAPQIFMHYLKLIAFPKTLTLDQTVLVKLGKSIFDPYSIFCILVFFLWITLPLYLFLKKKAYPNFFLLCFSFLISLIPFLHILAPSYLLAAERYLYFPLALLIFCTLKILLNSQHKKILPVTIILLSLTLSFSLTRAFIRTTDWRDNYSFSNASLKALKDPFFKAVRFLTYSEIELQDPGKYINQAFKLLKESKKETKILKGKYQNNLPLVVKSYGLDYNSKLAKIAYLECTVKFFKLGEEPERCIKILSPYIKDPGSLDPSFIDLYAKLLLKENKIKEAKSLLLETNKYYSHIGSILIGLFEISRLEGDIKGAEQYLTEALKYYPFDISIIGKAILFFNEIKNYSYTAKYAYFYGLLTQSPVAYKQALESYIELSDVRNSKKVIEKLTRVATNDPEALYSISKFYYKTNDKQNAFLSLKAAFLTSKNSPEQKKLTFDIGHTLIRFYLDSGYKDEAESFAKEIAVYADNDLESLIKLAKLYKTLGMDKELNLTKHKILTTNWKGK